MSGSKTRPPIPDDPYGPTPRTRQILFVVPEPGAVTMEYLWDTVKRHGGVILEKGGERLALVVESPLSATAEIALRSAGARVADDPARQELAAIWGALEELSRWPDLPGVPYAVYDPARPEEGKLRQIRGSDVAGIFEAIQCHVRELSSFGKHAVEAYYREQARPSSREALADWATGLLRSATFTPYGPGLFMMHVPVKSAPGKVEDYRFLVTEEFARGVAPNNVANTEKESADGRYRKPTALCELPLLESNQDSPDPEAGNKGELEG